VEEHYPFPQYLNGAWIDQRVAGRAMYWIVAENRGEPIGTGAIIRIGGGPRHRISGAGQASGRRAGGRASGRLRAP
jgi:hypothetical protein